MSRSYIATILLTLLSISHGWTLTIEGQIVDAETQIGIPYASIGVLNKGIGTVSDEKGYFLLSWTDAKKITKEDSLAFLHIGYQTLRLRIADIMTEENTKKPLFSLTKEEIELPTISIEADEFKNEKVLGRKVEKQNVNLYYQSNQKGTELAALFLREFEALHVADGIDLTACAGVCVV